MRRILHFHTAGKAHEYPPSLTYINMYARERGAVSWVGRVGLTSLPNSHRVILDAFDNVLIYEKEFGTVLAFNEHVYELKLIRRETEKSVKELDDGGLGLFKVKPFFLSKDFLEIVAEKPCLCGKNSKLQTIVCWHNLKMLNVGVDLSGNVEAPLVDKCGALFHRGETGDAAVAMVATDRNEFIRKMQSGGKEREHVTDFFVKDYFIVAFEIGENMVNIHIMDGVEAVQQFLCSTTEVNAINAVDYGTFNICYAYGTIVVKRQNALGYGIAKVSVAETVKIKRCEAGVADNGHFVKWLMRKSMVFHCRMVGNGCRRSNGSGYLDLGCLRRRGGKIPHTIEVTPHFGNEATRLVVEQKFCCTLFASGDLHHIFLSEYELPLQLWKIVEHIKVLNPAQRYCFFAELQVKFEKTINK